MIISIFLYINDWSWSRYWRVITFDDMRSEIIFVILFFDQWNWVCSRINNFNMMKQFVFEWKVFFRITNNSVVTDQKIRANRSSCENYYLFFRHWKIEIRNYISVPSHQVVVLYDRRDTYRLFHPCDAKRNSNLYLNWGRVSRVTTSWKRRRRTTVQHITSYLMINYILTSSMTIRRLWFLSVSLSSIRAMLRRSKTCSTIRAIVVIERNRCRASIERHSGKKKICGFFVSDWNELNERDDIDRIVTIEIMRILHHLLVIIFVLLVSVSKIGRF